MKPSILGAHFWKAGPSPGPGWASKLAAPLGVAARPARDANGISMENVDLTSKNAVW